MYIVDCKRGYQERILFLSLTASCTYKHSGALNLEHWHVGTRPKSVDKHKKKEFLKTHNSHYMCPLHVNMQNQHSKNYVDI